jgi:hypothetical protein
MNNSLFVSNLPKDLRVETAVERRLLAEYGSMFVARGVTVPNRIVFRDEADVSAFQESLSIRSEIIAGHLVELQSKAMEDLLLAKQHAENNGLSISPRFADSARRSYADTVELWASRVEPGLRHWVSEGELDRSEAARIASLSPFEQVPKILELEERKLYFAKDLSKSIVYSVAPPGTSQHLSMLAIDIAEFENVDVREIMAKQKWYQTVVSDLPHFTYLGVVEAELPALGLTKVVNGNRRFWIPNIVETS